MTARAWFFPAAFALGLCLIGLAIGGRAWAADTDTQAAGRPTAPVIAVLDFELVGDLGDESRIAEHEIRLKMIGDTLREELRRSGLYTVADNGAAGDLIADLSAHQYLHRCNGCEFDVGHRLGADQVLVPWVYRVSNLVLTLHVEIKDVATHRVLLKRSFGFRGDSDIGWVRAVRYFVREQREWAQSTSN
jgi:hypothetical protein